MHGFFFFSAQAEDGWVPTVEPSYKNTRYKNTLLKTSAQFINSLGPQGYFLVKPTTFAKNNPAIFLIFPGPEHILIAKFYCNFLMFSCIHADGGIE
jgi:hypothetical protein